MSVCVYVSAQHSENGTVFEQWGEGVCMNVYVIAVWVITDWAELTDVIVEGGYRGAPVSTQGKPQISSNSVGAEGHIQNCPTKHKVEGTLKDIVAECHVKA